jgi:hypothetical protein
MEQWVLLLWKQILDWECHVHSNVLTVKKQAMFPPHFRSFLLHCFLWTPYNSLLNFWIHCFHQQRWQNTANARFLSVTHSLSLNNNKCYWMPIHHHDQNSLLNNSQPLHNCHITLKAGCAHSERTLWTDVIHRYRNLHVFLTISSQSCFQSCGGALICEECIKTHLQSDNTSIAGIPQCLVSSNCTHWHH